MLLKMWIAVLLCCLAVLGSGCGYLSDRGDDAMEMFDIGITVTDHWMPQFAFYMDYFQFMPIGYSNFDGKLLGIGNSQAGWIDSYHRSWGVLTTGVEDKQNGTFDPFDPRQARPDMIGAKERPPYYTGLLPAKSLGEKSPMLQHAECDRVFHFGWIGFMMICRPLDWFDFLGGWFGIDYMSDDDWAAERRFEKARAPKETKPVEAKPKPAPKPKAGKKVPAQKSHVWNRSAGSEGAAGGVGSVESESDRFRREEMERARGASMAADEKPVRPQRREPKKESSVKGVFMGVVNWMRSVEDWVWNHW